MSNNSILKVSNEQLAYELSIAYAVVHSSTKEETFSLFKKCYKEFSAMINSNIPVKE